MAEGAQFGVVFVKGIDPFTELGLLLVAEDWSRNRPDIALQPFECGKHRLGWRAEQWRPVVFVNHPAEGGHDDHVQQRQLRIRIRCDREGGRR